MAVTVLKPLSLSDWEALIDDYSLNGVTGLHRWTGGGISIIDLCISSLARKDFPSQLKLNLLIFLEHRSLEEFCNWWSASSLSGLIDALRSVIQSPNDPLSFKDQFLVSTSSLVIASLPDNDKSSSFPALRDLVELLLTIINRPNHGLDRHTRGIACECLRQLEVAFPCLLFEITPHLWFLCQNERTHVSQWYVLLFSTAILNLVKLKPICGNNNGDVSITNATIPLVPFNVPLQSLVHGDFVWKEREVNYKELRRVVSFLLECPQYLTPFGLAEFMVAIVPVAQELELQASLLRVQFSWLLYTFNPLLCHSFLRMYLKFADSFRGQECEVASRLWLLSREAQQHLAFRLLGLHWMLGFFSVTVGVGNPRKRSILDMSSNFYPMIFDPLAIKALELDLLVYCSSLISKNPGDANGAKGVVDNKVYGLKMLEDGLVSVSDFKWLPPWSTETAVAFRSIHKFFIGGSLHNDATSLVAASVESNIFYILQKMLVDSTLEYRGLVPVTITCIDRLVGCVTHRWLGDHLLTALDKHLLPKLEKDYNLGHYFPIFERISENDKVCPSRLIDLLTRFMIFLVDEHGPDTGLKSWHYGSKTLSICRKMLIHRHSSSLFTGLSHLLASTSLYFPDLEVRDNARFYLRMLICVPGKKLKDILNMGESMLGISSSSHSGAFFSFQSDALFRLKRSSSITSYIHIERVMPLFVNQSWSLSLPNFGINHDKPGFFEGIRDKEPTEEKRDFEVSACGGITSGSEMLRQQLCVTDARVSEIVRVLRRHFAFIPDYRHMPGIKITVCCSLMFDSEAFSAALEVMNVLDEAPGLYATVLKFTSSAPYGPISPFHIPLVLGSPLKSVKSMSEPDSPSAVVQVRNDHVADENFKASICIELEPREPMPGLVDVFIETNADNGQVIQGQLQSISVGIEDMFLRAIGPDGIEDGGGPSYYADLFNALWEACETSSTTPRETFGLKGGKGLAAVGGTQSVKLVEISVASLVQAVELHLAPFVVCVIGQPLVDMVQAGGVIKDTVWKDMSLDSPAPLFIKYFGDEEDDGGVEIQSSRKNIGYFQILIFLPPRFHLLFQMELHEFSTLVRIRTDHWPCLAYVDEYLEALFLG